MTAAAAVLERPGGTIRVTAGRIEEFIAYAEGITARAALAQAGIPVADGHSALIAGRVKPLDTVLTDPNVWIQRVGKVENG